MDTKARRKLAGGMLVLLSLMATPLHAQDHASCPTLEPVWVQTMRPGIEWAEPIARGPGALLAAATRAGRLWLVDVTTGRQLSPEPIRIGPGARLVPPNRDSEPTDLVYLFDRHAACAVRVASPVGLEWRFGTPLSPSETLQTDPEVLVGWTHGGTFGSDLLLLGSAGRVVLLSAEHGRPRWEIELGRLPLARLHVMNSAAVVLYKTAGEVRAAFIDCSNGRPIVTRRRLGQDWPLWSGLIADGLLTLSTNRATLWPRIGPPRRHPLDTVELRTAAIAVYLPPDADHGPGEAHGGKPLLWIGDGDYVRRYELSFANRSALRPSASIPCSHSVESLRVSGQRVIACCWSAVSVFDADTGVLMGTCRSAGGRLVASWTDGQRLYGCFRSTASGGDALTLVTIDLSKAAASHPVEPRCAPDSHNVGRADELRQVLWAARHLVLVETKALRAYKLP